MDDINNILQMNNIDIIGICGRKFNGKDTVADYLVKHHGYTKVSFGDPLKRSLQCIFGFTDEQLWGLEKEKLDSFWNITPRETMQYVGTECFRIKFGMAYPQIGDNIWVMAMNRQLMRMINDGITKIVIPDVRFPNEEQLIRQFSGRMFRIIRKNFTMPDTHASENALQNIVVDNVIINDTIEELYKTVDHIMK